MSTKEEVTLSTRDFALISDARGGFKPVDAIFQFFYKDYQISVSTAGMSQGACQIPVCIFDRKDTDKIVKDGFNTVEEAIDWINNQSVVKGD